MLLWIPCPMSLCVVHKPIADLFESPELNSPLVHQLLLGENLVIKKETENHYFIQTEYECYTGFVKKKDCTLSDTPYAKKNTVVITGRTVSLQSQTCPYAVAGTKLEAIARDEHYYRVRLPSKESVFVLQRGATYNPKKGKAEDIIATAERVRWWHIPYLWGGVTPLGIDCSGMMKLVTRINTIWTFPRDAWQQCARTTGAQYNEHAPADKINDHTKLLPGDMVFFTAPEEERVKHVGLMITETEFIHASKKMHELTKGLNALATSTFENDPVFGDYYKDYFICGRRFFP